MSSISDNADVFEMKKGRWLFIPAGHNVTHDQYEGLDLISIHFSLLYYSNPGIIAIGDKLYHGASPEIMDVLQAVVQKTAPGVTESILLQKMLCDFILTVMAENKKDMNQYLHELQPFQTLFELFQRNIKRNFSVADMAKVMKMGNETFVKKFKLSMRCPPKKYFNRLRAAAAADQLRSSNLSIREIAAEFGFANEFYFSRFIKQHLGMSPREWRDRKYLRT